MRQPRWRNSLRRWRWSVPVVCMMSTRIHSNRLESLWWRHYQRRQGGGGRDRIHVAVLTQESFQLQKWGLLWSLELTKDAYTREQAESIADEMIRCALVELVESEPDDSFFRAAGLKLETLRFEA